METSETMGELVESNFLLCAICSAHYIVPSILPCLHAFCLKCIENLPKEVTIHQSKENNSVENSSPDANDESSMEIIDCPVCCSAVGIPGKGRFPEDPFLSHMCEMYSLKHNEERSCDYCRFDKKSVDAVSLCLQCRDDMCEDCTEAHRKTKITREHKVVPYKQIKSGLFDTDIRQNQHTKCPEHDVTVTSFCENCEKVTCPNCNCHKTSPLDGALPKYHKQLQGLQDSIDQRLPNIEKYVEFMNGYDESLEETRQKMMSNIENQANTLHTVIDATKNRMQSTINEKCQAERKLVRSKVANLETATKSLKNNASYIRRLIKHGKAGEVLSLHREITSRLSQLVRMQLDGIDSKLQLSFTPGNSSDENAAILFGKLKVDSVPLGKAESTLANATSPGLRLSSVLPNVRSKVEPICAFDAEGQRDEKDVWPTGIAISKSGDIVIADRDNRKVKIFNENGRMKTEFTGKGDNKIGTPFDVAVLHNGNIAITDYEQEDVKVFSRIGDHVFSIRGYFKHPRGITVNEKGEIIVVDCRLLQISFHDPKNGNLIRKIDAKNEAGKKVLVDPYYVTTTHENNVIVTDTAAPNIKVFSPSGKYLAEYGDYGTKDDQILQPYGVCVDEYGYIFIADNHNHRVHLLKPDGKLSKFLLTKNDSLWHPMGVAITKNGYFIVTEALGKVRIFKYI
ncbi:hypothetical protein FSP39_016385 [Pinctada imbricata]|uniref:Uncharacterized protein n=1 Tax=Pinctada imbricata TaxID=66713 RepID=A0AA89BI36_PINIB|nr:hypothetical protein FSP39_016385 [Pinctada imbricata]